MARALHKKRRTKQGVIVEELGAIHQWMKDHERHDDGRFAQASGKMQNLATKDDLSTVMLDQASKTDMKKLTDALFDSEGKAKFATKEDMQPVLDLYRGSTFARSLFAGGATFVITIVAVGYAILQIISWAKKVG